MDSFNNLDDIMSMALSVLMTAPRHPSIFEQGFRVYLDTSAFTAAFESYGPLALAGIRAFQRERGVVFVASPVLLWELMTTSDRRRADELMMAAQCLFDPVLLASPSDLLAAYVMHVTESQDIPDRLIRSEGNMASIWSRMTIDLGARFNYDCDALAGLTRPARLLSKHASTILSGSRSDEMIVDLCSSYVSTIFDAIAEDVAHWGLDPKIVKLALAHLFALLVLSSDINVSPSAGYILRDRYAHPECVSEIILSHPKILVDGPLIAMSRMLLHQLDTGRVNRGSMHDGMHILYAEHVDLLMSADRAFADFVTPIKTRAYIAPVSDIALIRPISI